MNPSRFNDRVRCFTSVPDCIDMPQPKLLDDSLEERGA
jgi:hypothetical protein